MFCLLYFRHFIKGDCKFTSGCRRSHNILDRQPMTVLQKFGIDVGQNPANLVKVVRYKKRLESGEEDLDQGGAIGTNSYGDTDMSKKFKNSMVLSQSQSVAASTQHHSLVPQQYPSAAIHHQGLTPSQRPSSAPMQRQYFVPSQRSSSTLMQVQRPPSVQVCFLTSSYAVFFLKKKNFVLFISVWLAWTCWKNIHRKQTKTMYSSH